ncbi:MAG: hypothetical protein AB4041_13305 [Microcystaceae cyanobacterium]
MINSNLLSEIQQLSKADKLYIMQVLVSELAQQETEVKKRIVVIMV